MHEDYCSCPVLSVTTSGSMDHFYAKVKVCTRVSTGVHLDPTVLLFRVYYPSLYQFLPLKNSLSLPSLSLMQDYVDFTRFHGVWKNNFAHYCMIGDNDYAHAQWIYCSKKLGCLGMLLCEGVNGIHKHLDVVRFHIGVDPVPEIGNPTIPAKLRDELSYHCLYLLLYTCHRWWNDEQGARGGDFGHSVV